MYPNFSISAPALTLLCARALTDLKAVVTQVTESQNEGPSIDATLLVLEEALAAYRDQIDPIIFLRNVSPDAAVRTAAEKANETDNAYMIELFANEDLYKILKNLKKAMKGYTPDQCKLLTDDYLPQFERNGLSLTGPKRKLFLKKKHELTKIEQTFHKVLREDRSQIWLKASDLQGLPEDYLQGRTKDSKGRYKITTKYPDIIPIMEKARDPNTRKKVYTLYNKRGGRANLARMQRAVGLRQDLAKLLGFKDHASFVLSRRMAKSPTNVKSFLSGLQTKITKESRSDLALYRQLKANDDAVPKAERKSLNPWDINYYQTKHLQAHLGLDPEDLKPYLPTDYVISGMFSIFSDLLGVTFKEESVALWHPDAKAYGIYDSQSGRHLATFLADLFPREGKYGHAAAFNLHTSRRLASGTHQLPLGAMVCNFPAPKGSSPGLMQHSDVETLFHEFGHVLHHTLSRVNYSSQSGFAVKWDFVETPSQLLENWTWNATSLKRITKHYQSGETMPDALIKKLLASKHLNNGYHYMRQIYFATFDQTLHTKKGTVNPDAIAKGLFKKLFGITVPKTVYPVASFGHIMGGYDAGYYSYLWSEVFAVDVFSRFAKDGIFNAQTGRDYRRLILEPGASRDENKLLHDFLGRKPNNKAFVASLNVEKAGLRSDTMRH